jgi:acyl carrier protein
MDHRAVILEVIGRVAPDVELAAVAPNDDLREQLELDSMDYLTIVTMVCERTGIEIPEGDYSRIATLDDFVAYVDAKAA